MEDWLRAVAAVKGGEVLRPIYVLRGDEAALKERFVSALRNRMAAEAGEEVGVLRYWFDDDGVAGAILSCQSVGLFGANDLVLLERCTLFGASVKSKVDPAVLESYLANPVQERVFLVTVPEDAWDERKRIAKLAKGYGVIDCRTPKLDVATRIVAEIARERGLTIAPPGVAELLRRTASITMAERELEKLSTYADGVDIDVVAVQSVVAAPVEDNVFEWVAAVMDGQASRAFRCVRDLLQDGNDPLGLLALLARQVRLIWFAKWGAAKRMSHAEIASQVGAHPFAVKTAANQAEGVPHSYLEHLLTIVADAEYAVKSGRRDMLQALDWVVMSCLASKPLGRRVR